MYNNITNLLSHPPSDIVPLATSISPKHSQLLDLLTFIHDSETLSDGHTKVVWFYTGLQAYPGRIRLHQRGTLRRFCCTLWTTCCGQLITSGRYCYHYFASFNGNTTVSGKASTRCWGLQPVVHRVFAERFREGVKPIEKSRNRPVVQARLKSELGNV